MKVKELIEELTTYDQELEVVIWDADARHYSHYLYLCESDSVEDDTLTTNQPCVEIYC